MMKASFGPSAYRNSEGKFVFLKSFFTNIQVLKMPSVSFVSAGDNVYRRFKTEEEERCKVANDEENAYLKDGNDHHSTLKVIHLVKLRLMGGGQITHNYYRHHIKYRDV